MYGYVGKVLRVDLMVGTCAVEPLDEATVRKWVGGSGLGTKYLLEEVPAGTQWSDPENLLIITSGPLGGSGAIGGGSINVTGLGPMTGGAAISQANGFMGAYMKFSGFDGIVLHEQGKIIDVNVKGAHQLGYSREELLKKSLFDFVAAEDMEQTVARIKMATEEPELEYEGLELRLIRKDGTKIDVEYFSRATVYDRRQVRVIALL